MPTKGSTSQDPGIERRLHNSQYQELVINATTRTTTNEPQVQGAGDSVMSS
ncbi:hypothetical protein RhiJN_21473 [Ceratobasidium sp. AG-Ba]|nr:hypothetical protein RhiJN_21473 [Ceratobasidium sp. AG-Ba]